MLEENDIHISTEDVQLPEINWGQLRRWIQAVGTNESVQIGSIRIRFCSDEFLLHLNRTYLDHDYYTDILTFPLSYDPIDTDIIISLERVIDHARERQIEENTELLRVIIHGFLHMCGYEDLSDEEKKQMRTLENEYLELWTKEYTS